MRRRRRRIINGISPQKMLREKKTSSAAEPSTYFAQDPGKQQQLGAAAACLKNRSPKGGQYSSAAWGRRGGLALKPLPLPPFPPSLPSQAAAAAAAAAEITFQDTHTTTPEWRRRRRRRRRRPPRRRRERNSGCPTFSPTEQRAAGEGRQVPAFFFRCCRNGTDHQKRYGVAGGRRTRKTIGREGGREGGRGPSLIFGGGGGGKEKCAVGLRVCKPPLSPPLFLVDGILPPSPPLPRRKTFFSAVCPILLLLFLLLSVAWRK